MKYLGLSDEETAALTQQLHDIVESDRYPFSPLRIRTLTTILAKLDTPAPLRAGMVPRVVRAAAGLSPALGGCLWLRT
jgi:hypothetical protein